MIYKNLEFFLKSGDSLNLDFDVTNNLWTGSLYVPKISTGLFESEHIFIYENILDQDNTLHICKPHGITNNSNIDVSWEDTSIEQFKLYNTENTNIIFTNSLSLSSQYYTTDYIQNGFLKSYNIELQYLQINISAYSDIEGSYYNLLQLKESSTNYTFARILIYGEFEGEDERLEVLCNNLGYPINKEDELIFTDSDIEEPKTNYILLNQKRKEILLEGSNIFPFIGSYKGLLNAISYFGFDELTIREYWKNINSTTTDYLKLKHFDIGIKKLNNQEILSNNYKKINDLSLVYKINEVIPNRYDKFDLPVTNNLYKYTIDEVLIKLFGLKNKLKNTFLPYNIYIKDVIGEKTFFSSTTKLSTTSINGSLFIEQGLTPQIKLKSTNNYIIDLRNIDELITQYELSVNHNLKANDLTIISELYNYILALFTNTYPGIKSIERLSDKDDIQIGCPIILSNETFNESIQNIEATYNDLTSENDYIYDFEVSGFGIQDTFVLTETVSNTIVTYTSTTGENNNSIINNIKILIDSKKINSISPWNYFDVSIVQVNGFDVIRLIGTGLNDNIRFDFQTSVIIGLGTNSKTFKKIIIPSINSKTIETISYKNYYEIEWRVYNNTTFNHTVRGGINEYKELLISLPYVGFYNVDVTLFNTLNTASKKTFINFIEVKMKEVEFVGIYKRISEKYTDIKSLDNISFEEEKISSLFPIVVNETQLKDCNVTFDTLDTIGILPNTNFSDNLTYTIQNYKPDGSISFPGVITFESTGDIVTIDSLKYLTFEMLDLTGNTPATFKIISISTGGEINIIQKNYNIGKHIFTTNNLELCVQELNNSQDKIISKYIYNLVSSYIQATGKITGEYSDFVNINVFNVEIENVNNSKIRGFLLNDFIILKDFDSFTGCAYIMFSADPCKIPGKKFYEWTITNIQILDYTPKIFNTKEITFFFYEKGNYQVELKITDKYNNAKLLKKNMINIK